MSKAIWQRLRFRTKTSLREDIPRKTDFVLPHPAANYIVNEGTGVTVPHHLATKELFRVRLVTE